MPLRDHFHSPLDDLTLRDGLFGGWPAMIVMALSRTLPQRYAAGPRVYLGSIKEIGESTSEPGTDEYEVRVFDMIPARRQVAAIELVSPTTKERPEHRRALVAKCEALLQNQVSVTIIDLVTTHNCNLYSDLLDLIGQKDPSLGTEPPPLYAVGCRVAQKEDAWLLQTWSHVLTLGQPLPTLPLWLADNLAVPLALEESYEETCRVLRIP